MKGHKLNSYWSSIILFFHVIDYTLVLTLKLRLSYLRTTTTQCTHRVCLNRLTVETKLLVELELIQDVYVKTTLSFSKHSSPIFAQRKLNRKLRLLKDSRQIHHLIKHHYKEHNKPVTAIVYAAHHIAGKMYFCKLDCSQAYHCLRIADNQSSQLLSFSLGSRTFAHKRLV